MTDQYTLKTLSNAIDVLSLFEREHSLTIKEIQQETHMNRTNLYRILYTLRSRGVLEVDPQTGEYRLGMKIIHLSSLLLQRLDVKTIAHPYLCELRDKIYETIHLVVLSNNLAAFVDKVVANEDINMGSYIGWTAPLYSTASGKLLLSSKEDEHINSYINKTDFKKFTDCTLIKKEVFIQDIAKIRKQGYSIDAEEMVEGLTCFAAPIKNHREEVIAAVSISGPTTRMLKNKEKILKELLNNANNITESVNKTPQGTV
ncbi:IclR family transcriptional regulator [Lentibacillus salinarum]